MTIRVVVADDHELVRRGIRELLEGEGDIEIVGETYTDNWDPANAQTEMEQFLTAEDNKVDAVLSENDGMASGVVGSMPAARKGSTAAGTSICAGAPGSMTTRSLAASARAKTSRACSGR